MFKLEFETDNAAFTDDAQIEIVRVLRATAIRIANTPYIEARDSGKVRDANGNTVGRWEFTP